MSRSAAVAGSAAVASNFAVTGMAESPQATAHQRVLHSIFSEQILRQNVLAISRRAAELPPAERFEFLSRWVMPNAARRTLRLHSDFAPVNPAPPVAAMLRRAREEDGPLISPALELISVAGRLNRLEQLQDAVPEPDITDIGQQKAVAAFRAAIAVQQNDFAAAETAMNQLRQLAATNAVVFAERWPEAIAVWQASIHPQTRAVARDLAFLLYEQARNGQGPRSERWHRHVYALKQHLETEIDGDMAKTAEGVEDVSEAGTAKVRSGSLLHWHPMSRTTAETRGVGYPEAAWRLRTGEVQHVAGHDQDYLVWSIPLTGDFTVEADLTTFGYKDIHLGFGNLWAGPGYDHKSCLNGNFRRDFASRKIDPPLTQTGDWMRARLVVQDGRRRSLINGRIVFEAEQDSGGDPWLAVHSGWYTGGTVRNLSVTGEAVVPETILLASRLKLPGWLPYFDESTGQADSDWRWVADPESGKDAAAAADSIPNNPIVEEEPSTGSGVIVRRHLTHLSGIRFESLLRYHRPMVEDGVIDYEFFYEPGRCVVHPCLDRLAMLLDPDGVRIHWVTDGKFERFPLDAANSSDEEPSRRGPDRLPLKENAWNRLRLQLTGDVVDLRLNGQHIWSRPLEPDNQRTFGLFLFADSTEARIRNIRWTGAWPRQIPAVADQELVGDPLSPMLAEVQNLPEVFRHDFSSGLPADRFFVFDGGLGTDIVENPDGLSVVRPGGEGYLKYGVGPRLQIGGNFDVSVTFDQLQTSPSAGGNANCQLVLDIADEVRSSCRIYRRHEPGTQAVWSAIFRRHENETRYLFPQRTAEESTSGCLRMIRTGRQLHYLFAEEDSNVFRLIDTQDVGSDLTTEGGIRLVLETQGAGRSAVVWKNLTVQAEQMLQDNTLAPEVSVVQLNSRRADLPLRSLVDFSTDPVRTDSFQLWGATRVTAPKPKGFLIVSNGAANWTADGLASLERLRGDFDVTLDVHPESLALPRAGDETAVILQTEFSDPQRTAIEIKYIRASEGNCLLEAMRRVNDEAGRPVFRSLRTAPVDIVDGLRIVRHGEFSYLLYREPSATDWKLLTGLRTGAAAVLPANLRTIVHTGGPNRQSRVWLRGLRIHCDPDR
ncbi:MAG: DUF1583 domain-containing protein [Fuerstiella sp.]